MEHNFNPAPSALGTCFSFIMLLIYQAYDFVLPILSGLCLLIGIISGTVTIIATLPKAFDGIDKIKKRFKKK